MPVHTVETRPGTEADVMPDRVLRPVSVEELVAVLHTTPAERTAVIPVGAGTKTGWAEPPTSCHIVLATTGPGRVVAEAVERHEVLQAQVGQAGQMPANASRPRRPPYGTARDLLIGVISADGTTARAVGKVGKNVPACDLGKRLLRDEPDWGGRGEVLAATVDDVAELLDGWIQGCQPGASADAPDGPARRSGTAPGWLGPLRAVQEGVRP